MKDPPSWSRPNSRVTSRHLEGQRAEFGEKQYVKDLESFSVKGFQALPASNVRLACTLTGRQPEAENASDWGGFWLFLTLVAALLKLQPDTLDLTVRFFPFREVTPYTAIIDSRCSSAPPDRLRRV